MKRMPFATSTRKIHWSGVAVAVMAMLAWHSLLPVPARGETQGPGRQLCEGNCAPVRLVAQRDPGWIRVMPPAPAVPAMTPIPPATGAGCIDEGQTCVLNGTPCCGSFECKGTFPNTTCQ